MFTKAAQNRIALAHELGRQVTAYCAIEPLQPIYIKRYAFISKDKR